MLKVILKGHPTADFLNAHSFGGYTALHLAYQFKQTAMVDHLEAGLSKCTALHAAGCPFVCTPLSALSSAPPSLCAPAPCASRHYGRSCQCPLQLTYTL